MDALELLTGDARAFVEKVWASQVHVHHAAPADVVPLLSIDDADRLLTSSGIRTPAVRLARDGTVLAASTYTRKATLAGVAMTGLVDARKLLDRFDEGATIVLQGLHRYWQPLTDLVRALELELGHPGQANAYLTPPGAQGFAVHSDTHDVFVFQTYGHKRWEIHDDSGVREVLMEPGSSMYLPTGTAHAARTEDSASLHVTVGINQVTWRHVVERAVAAAGPATLLDRHLPAAYLHDQAAFSAQLADVLVEVTRSIAALDADAVSRAEVDRFLTTRTTVAAGALHDRIHVGSLAADSSLRRRAGVTCELVPAGDRLRVLLGDRELVVPAWLTPALELVRSRHTVTPQDLHEHLDPTSALVLTRRLVREGLLEVVR